MQKAVAAKNEEITELRAELGQAIAANGEKLKELQAAQQAATAKLQAELDKLRVGLNEEVASRVYYEGKVCELRAWLRRATGARQRAGDELYFG